MSAPDFGEYLARVLSGLTLAASAEVAADHLGDDDPGPDDVADLVINGLVDRVSNFRSAGVASKSEERAELRDFLGAAALLLARAAARLDPMAGSPLAASMLAGDPSARRPDGGQPRHLRDCLERVKAFLETGRVGGKDGAA